MLIEPLLLQALKLCEDKEWIAKKAIEHNTLWAKKIFTILEENKIEVKQTYQQTFF